MNDGITKIYLVSNCYGDPNKVYIGKTKNSRIISHKQKFGKQIKYVYIDEINSLNKKDWKPLECYWIEQFRQWGFELMNKNKGGGGPEFVLDEIKNKISKANKGKPKSQEHKENISKGMKGCKIWSKGKKFTKEHCNKISKNSRGKPKPSESYLCKRKYVKSILQYNLDGILIKKWNCIEDASKFLNILGESIINCCKYRCKTSGGFIWRYYTINFPHQISSEIPHKKPKDFGKHKNKSIIQYNLDGDFIKEYISIKHASEETKISRYHISDCLKNKVKKIKYVWKWKKID